MKVFISFLIISFSFFGFITSSNSGGIKFRRLSFEEAKKESIKTGKIIFIHVHTSWCGPCKKMAATSFQDPKLAEIYNDKFINLKIDAEKVKKESKLQITTECKDILHYYISMEMVD